jgi:hypothetical protein
METLTKMFTQQFQEPLHPTSVKVTTTAMPAPTTITKIIQLATLPIFLFQI